MECNEAHKSLHPLTLPTDIVVATFVDFGLEDWICKSLPGQRKDFNVLPGFLQKLVPYRCLSHTFSPSPHRIREHGMVSRQVAMAHPGNVVEILRRRCGMFEMKNWRPLVF